MILANSATFSNSEDGSVVFNGNSTEKAMQIFSEKMGREDLHLKHDDANCSELEKMTVYGNLIKADFESVALLEFDSIRKTMSTVVKKNGTDTNLIYIKGAAEMLIQSSSSIMTKDGKIKNITSSHKTA